MTEKWDAIVVGGGFYGCALALHLKTRNERVLLLEREDGLLKRASFVNQARVHNGYHYPRSLLTAIRSHINYRRFKQDYAYAIDDSFEKVYAIAKNGSKTSAAQYRHVAEAIGAPIIPAPDRIKKLFNPEMIEEAFLVEECAFDAIKLRDVMMERMESCGVGIEYKCEVNFIADGLRVHFGDWVHNAGQIFLCAYSQTSAILERSSLPLLPLKHEMTEVCLIEPPAELKHLGITVMDGEFFSTMPFPPSGTHSLTHVRWTPHAEWLDTSDPLEPDPRPLLGSTVKTNYQRMADDAYAYLPCMSDAKHVKSLFDVKTVLQSNEVDDGRPVLFKRDYGLRGLNVVIGGKLDNAYDVIEELCHPLS